MFAKASTGDHDSMFIAEKSLTALKPASWTLATGRVQAPKGQAGATALKCCWGRGLPGQDGAAAVREHQVFLGSVDCRVSKETAALTVDGRVDRPGLQADVVNSLSVLR